MSAPSRFVVAVVLATGPLTLAAAAAQDDPQQVFKQALALAEQGDKAGAIQVLDRLAADHPNRPNLFWNLGTWKAEVGDHAGALASWKHYRELEPDDWRARAKLIQSYQALGQSEPRDKEIKALKELYESGTDKELMKTNRYCREQLKIAGRSVFVFEFFKPTGERRVFYRFSIVGADDREEYWYSLGSYDSTAEIAWELGEIPRDKRLHHLDLYRDAGRMHSTIRFYEDKPSYDDVRSHLIQAMEKGPAEK